MHNRAVPSPRYHAYPALIPDRPRRRPRRRFALGGAALALVALFVVPAFGTPARPLDLDDHGAGHEAVGQEPVASPSVPPAEAPAPSVAPSDPPPAVPTEPPRVAGPGRPPSRLAAEMSGTKAPAVALLTGYRWPLAHPRLTLPFGPTPWGSRIVAGEQFHDGIDIATFCGDRVMAAHAGTVIAAGRRFDDVIGWVGDLGRYYRRLDRKHAWITLPIMVVIDDGNGYRSMYAHFGRIVVRKGQVVKAGQLLGYEGMTGHASGCHVHYGLFSPWEMTTFRIRPDVVQRMKVPKREIARINPLRVLPPKPPAQARPTAPSGEPPSP